MAQVKLQTIRGKNQLAKIAETVRKGFLKEGGKRPVLSLRSDAERVAGADRIKLVRNINQHTAEYQLEQGEETFTFRAAKVK